MDQQEDIYIENGSPILGKEEYIFWSTRMKIYLKALGPGVWNALITDYIPPKIIRTPTQKKSNKNNANAIEAILDGISQSIKRKIGPCVSAKEPWVKLENIYSNEEITQTNLAICKYDSEDITQDEENLFIGTITQTSKYNLDVEREVNLET